MVKERKGKKAKVTAVPPVAVSESVAATTETPATPAPAPSVNSPLFDIYNHENNLVAEGLDADAAEKYQRKHGHNGWRRVPTGQA